MKINTQFYIILLSIFTIVACSSELKINYPNFTPKMVVNCNFSENGKFDIALTKSKSATDYNPIDFVSDAKVELFENDILKEIIPYKIYDSTIIFGKYTSTYKAKPNKKYSLKITHPTSGITTAEDLLPTKTIIQNLQLIQYPNQNNTNLLSKISFEMNDSINTNDFYIVKLNFQLERFGIDRNGDTIMLNNNGNYEIKNNEFLNTTFNNLIFFSDATFKGQHKKIDIDFIGYNADEPNITKLILYLEINHCGKSYYDYELSRKVKSFQNDGGEPIPISSNIINGLGHFSAYNNKIYSIRIK